MAKMRFRTEAEQHPYRSDGIIISMAWAAIGDDVSVEDALAAWEAYSESMAAGWMCLPSTEDYGTLEEAQEMIRMNTRPWLTEVD